MEQMNQPATPPSSGGLYGKHKRPLWQWIVAYIVIGGIVYGIIYYVWAARSGGYRAPQTGQTTTSPY